MFSSPARPATSAPPSSPSCSRPATRSSASPAPTAPPRRSGDFAGAVASDLRAIEAIGAGLEGSGKPFVSTSGTLMLAAGGISDRAGTEQDAFDAGPRIDAENTVVALAERGVRSAVVRLPPLVRSTLDDHGFGPALIAIGRGLGLPTASIAAADADAHFSYLGRFVAFDDPVSSALTRERRGWEPTHPGPARRPRGGPLLRQLSRARPPRAEAARGGAAGARRGASHIRASAAATVATHVRGRRRERALAS